VAAMARSVEAEASGEAWATEAGQECRREVPGETRQISEATSALLRGAPQVSLLSGRKTRPYDSVDAHGVALAAIQALKQTAEQRQRRIVQLERQRHELERRLRAFERRRDGRRQ